MGIVRSALSVNVIMGLPNVRDYIHKDRERLMEERRQRMFPNEMESEEDDQVVPAVNPAAETDENNAAVPAVNNPPAINVVAPIAVPAIGPNPLVAPANNTNNNNNNNNRNVINGVALNLRASVNNNRGGNRRRQQH